MTQLFERTRMVFVDVRYALRLLAKRPGYSAIVILVLALGVGTNVLTFGLFQAFALTPLGGVPHSTELQYLTARTSAGRDVALSYPDYEYLRDHASSYRSLAGSYVQGWMLGRGAEATQVFGELVTGNYFEVLGVHSQRGRMLAADDNRVRSGHPVAVISDSLWRGRFGAAPDIIGRTIQLETATLTVVGVAAAEFHGSVAGLGTDVFVPYMMQPALSGGVDRLDDREATWVYAFGRLRAGVTAAGARAEAASLGATLQRLRPLGGIPRRVNVSSIWQAPQGAQTYMLPAVSLMSAMSALLLLVVCANVAGLVLVRALGRTREIATRLALGSSRARIVRLLTMETALLALPGGVAGFFLPALAVPYLSAAQPTTTFFPLYFNAGGNPMLAAAVIVVLATVLLAGIAPALRASRVELAPIRQDGPTPASGRLDMRTVLVAAQVALSLLLVVITALVARSLANARSASPGFDRQVASVTIDLHSAGYDVDRARAFYRQLLQSLRNDPAVTSASLMKDPLLMLVDLNTAPFIPDGRQRTRDDDFSTLFNVVSTDHFRTLGIPVLAGRDFAERDDLSAASVVIVNDTFARRYFGDPAAAVGRRVETPVYGQKAMEWRTIVGVVRDIKYARLTEAPRPYAYLPHLQAFNGMMAVQARGRDGGTATVDVIRRHVRALDPDVPMMQAATLGELTSLGVGIYDVTARALAIVGAVAMLLMALGIFGLVAHTVQLRTRETGVRLAVGAPRRAIVTRFVTRGMTLAMAGVAVGIGGALAVTRAMTVVLYGVSGSDVASYATASAAVLLIALVAAFLPAWRGACVDPLIALRHE
jgi:predicted permease